MKQNKKSFTLIEMLVVIAIIGILAGMLSGPLMKARRKAQLNTCVNNLHQIGLALFQYTMPYQDRGISYFSDATDVEACTKNLLRLYVSGLNDNLAGFVCPISNFTPKDTDATANTTTVDNNDTCSVYTAYNMTTKYSFTSDPPNKIIVADMPYATTSGVVETASVHEIDTTRMDDGPNCLFQDNHVKNVKTLCPEGTSVYDVDNSHNVSIYATGNSDKGGKYSCILGVKRGS